MPNRTVADNHHYQSTQITLHQVNSLLIAVEQHGVEMELGDVLAAIGGIKALANSASESLDKFGDMEVRNV